MAQDVAKSVGHDLSVLSPLHRDFWLVLVVLFSLAQLVVLILLGPKTPGPAMVNIIHLAFVLLCLYVFLRAGSRSRFLARYFWFIAALSSTVFCVALLLNLYLELISPSQRIADWADLISVFWFCPVSLTLLLEPDFEPHRFDRIHILDFIQIILLWNIIYFYFLYLPRHDIAATSFGHTWLRDTRTGSLLYDSLMAGLFLVRSALTNCPVARAFFGRMGFFLVLVCGGDFYYNYFGTNLPTGSWYEVIWTFLHIVPIVIAATWNQTEAHKSRGWLLNRDFAGERLFPILFAFLILFLSMNFMHTHPLFSLVTVVISFVVSSLRLLVIQRRQEQVQRDLRAQILKRECVERELRENKEHLEELVVERATKLEQSSAQLRQAQKMEAIGQLAGGIAHDFNNLLTVIRGYSELMVERAPSPELRSNAERVDEAAARAASLTGQLLAFSRRQLLQPTIFNLNALVQNLEKMLRRVIGEDIELAVSLAPDVGSIRADHGQIEQVIMNLVINARDVMPQGGKLTLEKGNVHLDRNYVLQHPTAREGRYVLLAVADTGSGIAPENLPRIFEPFFTTKGVGKGTGLGLSTVYGIVKQSGGDVWVYSELGQGACFKVYFPVANAPAEPILVEQKIPANVRGNEAILLVEDDRQVRELARTVLVDCGYFVLTAEKPALAESISRDHPREIHLLLTDVVMPGLNGHELATQIIALRPQIKVLYMSGYTPNGIVHQAELGESMSFLPKPFTPAGLAAKVREVLDQDH